MLTEHFVDEPGHPTHDALNQVLAFFTERLASVTPPLLVRLAPRGWAQRTSRFR